MPLGSKRLRRAGPLATPIKARPFLYASALVALALVLGLPILAGLWQTVSGGKDALGTAWRGSAIELTLFTAVLATAISFVSALGLAACFQGRIRLLTWLSLPLLAVPHAAVAQSLALLLAPSGFLVRALSPWATGFERTPSNWLWDQHPDGWTLILALAIKELPYFLILLFTYAAALPTRDWLRAGQGLGYGPTASWWHLVLPQILPRLVLPLFVVLAFSLSVVDVAAIVGPSRLKTFAHGLQNAWQGDAPRAEVLAGSLWLLFLTLAALGLAWGLIFLWRRHMRHAQTWRQVWGGWGLPQIGAGFGLGLFSLAYLSLTLLPIQSVIETAGRRTRFPDLWTGQFGTKAWAQALDLALPTLPTTLLLGLLTTVLSLGAALWLLEGEAGRREPTGRLDIFLLLPLFLPQFAFLSGGAFLGLKAGLIPAQGFLITIWFHALFVFPYVFLVLAPAFRGLDLAYVRAGAGLGLSPWALFLRLKLPLLLRPMTYTFAWGMAVSLALYLPTFFASAGRFETLLTVGVTQLAGKGDSVRAVWGLLLLILPFLFFVAAASISGLQAWNRRGLRT